jgi:DNA-binding transcriptional LysR family regulator
MAEARQYFKELRLQQFRGLVALDRFQTFSAAAEALKLTRASVWQQVRALEKELACPLVRTRGHRVELTDAGHKLVEIVAPLVAGFDSVKATLASMQDSLPQTLVIATAPTFLIYELRDPISKIHQLFPQLHLTFLERNSPTAIELMNQGSADLAVVAKPDSSPMKSSLEYTKIATYPFTLICPRKHPLLTGKRITLRDLTRYRLILPSNLAYCRQHFDATMTKSGLLEKTNIVIESNFPVLHFQYVRMGIGVALAPLPADLPARLDIDQREVTLCDVSHLFGHEPIYYIRRKGEFETAVASKFRELVLLKRGS